jgi:hypothetical protein
VSRSTWRQPVKIAEAVSITIQRLGFEERFRQHEIWRVWPTVVGAQIVRHAQPHALWQGRLVVHVTDPVWLHHLSMMRHRLIPALNEKLRTSVIREMVLRIGEMRALLAGPSSGSAAPERVPRPDPANLSRIEALLDPLGDAPFRDALYRLLLRAYRPTGT